MNRNPACRERPAASQITATLRSFHLNQPFFGHRRLARNGAASLRRNPIMLQYLLTYLQSREEGQDLVEYALIIVLISIAIVVAMTALGGQINTVFNTIRTTLAT